MKTKQIYAKGILVAHMCLLPHCAKTPANQKNAEQEMLPGLDQNDASSLSTDSGQGRSTLLQTEDKSPKPAALNQPEATPEKTLWEFAEASDGGSLVGNGGDVIFCEIGAAADMPKEHLALLDIYEGGVLQKYDYDEDVSGMSPFEIVEGWVRQLASVDPHLSQSLLAYSRDLKQRVVMAENVALARINDSGAVAIPRSCQLVQIAVQQRGATEASWRVVVNADLYRDMSGMNQAALLLHEMIYRRLIEEGFTDSTAARRLVAYIVHKGFAAGTLRDYIGLCKVINVPYFLGEAKLKPETIDFLGNSISKAALLDPLGISRVNKAKIAAGEIVEFWPNGALKAATAREVEYKGKVFHNARVGFHDDSYEKVASIVLAEDSRERFEILIYPHADSVLKIAATAVYRLPQGDIWSLKLAAETAMYTVRADEQAFRVSFAADSMLYLHEYSQRPKYGKIAAVDYDLRFYDRVTVGDGNMIRLDERGNILDAYQPINPTAAIEPLAVFGPESYSMDGSDLDKSVALNLRHKKEGLLQFELNSGKLDPWISKIKQIIYFQKSGTSSLETHQSQLALPDTSMYVPVDEWEFQSLAKLEFTFEFLDGTTLLVSYVPDARFFTKRTVTLAIPRIKLWRVCETLEEVGKLTAGLISAESRSYYISASNDAQMTIDGAEYLLHYQTPVFARAGENICFPMRTLENLDVQYQFHRALGLP